MALENLKDNPKLVLALFSSGFCHICKKVHPVVQEIAAQYPDRVEMQEVDAISEPDTAAKYDVLNLPTLLVFKNGDIVERFTGFIPKNQLIKKLNLADK